MAAVKIYYEEAEDDLLPPVCACCGAAATTTVKKTFLWPPPSETLLLLTFHTNYRMKVRLPMCDAHRHHWTIRPVVYLFGLVLVGAGFISGFLTATKDDELGALMCIAALGFGVVWLLVAVVLHHTTIQAAKITRGHVLLVEVAEEFRDALLDEREEREYEERDDERWREDDSRDDCRPRES